MLNGRSWLCQVTLALLTLAERALLDAEDLHTILHVLSSAPRVDHNPSDIIKLRWAPGSVIVQPPQPLPGCQPGARRDRALGSPAAMPFNLLRRTLHLWWKSAAEIYKSILRPIASGCSRAKATPGPTCPLRSAYLADRAWFAVALFTTEPAVCACCPFSAFPIAHLPVLCSLPVSGAGSRVVGPADSRCLWRPIHVAVGRVGIYSAVPC